MFKDKAKNKKLLDMPLQWNVHTRIPKLLSLTNLVFGEDILLNVLTAQYKIAMPIIEQLTNNEAKDLTIRDLAEAADNLLRIQRQVQHFTSPLGRQLAIRINFGLYYIHLNLADFYSSLGKNSRAEEFSKFAKLYLKDSAINLNFLQEKPHEFSWYTATIIYLLSQEEKEVTHDDLDKLINCMKALPKHRQHKEAIYSWYVALCEYFPGYPDRDFFKEVDSLMTHKPWNHNGILAQMRHRHIKKILVNPVFFNYQENTSFDTEDEKTKKLTVKNNTIELKITSKKLQKFSAHIVPPSKPTLWIKIENEKEINLKKFNKRLKVNLRKKGIVNSEGFLNKSCLKNHIVFHPIKETIVDTINSTIRKFNNKTEQLKYMNNINFDAIKKHYTNLVNIQEQLAGFETIDMLALTEQALVKHQYGLPDQILTPVRQAVHGALKIFYLAKKINESKKSDSKKYNDWFKLAETILVDLENNPRSILIPVGTPIHKGKSSSDHAIYVVLKYSRVDSTWRVIISNGGSGVKTFHTCIANQDERDRKQYHYAAFKPFTLNAINKEALQHYLYTILRLEYIQALSDNKGRRKDEPLNYDNILANLYLRTNNKNDKELFTGYQFKEFANFTRLDLDDCLDAQFTGNCTMHNLKKALTIMFDMDVPTLGLLVDNLMLGCDQLISQHRDSNLAQSSLLQNIGTFSATQPLLTKSNNNTEIDNRPKIN